MRYKTPSNFFISLFSSLFSRVFQFILIFILTVQTAQAANKFEIKHADSLEVDDNKIRIEGNVIIQYKESNVEAKTAQVETDSEGQPQKAVFFNNAKIKLKDRTLFADKLTLDLNEKIIYAEGNTKSELQDKKNIPIVIYSDFQEVSWIGEGAYAEGNIKSTYQETKVSSDKAKIIYKNKKPYQAIFYSTSKKSELIQPTSRTISDEFIFDVNNQNIQAVGNVQSTIWPAKNKPTDKQNPVMFTAEELFIDHDSGIVTAESNKNKVNVIYEDTNGDSNKAVLLRDKESGKPQKIIFTGSANVTQLDKKLSSEEVVLNFNDKKLTSNTKTNIRPKTIIFKMD